MFLPRPRSTPRSPFALVMGVATLAAAPALGAPTVLVVPPVTQAGVAPEYGAVIAHELNARLLRAGIVNATDAKQLDYVLAGRKLVVDDLADQATLASAAKALGAHLVVSGNLENKGGVLHGQFTAFATANPGAAQMAKAEGNASAAARTLKEMTDAAATALGDIGKSNSAFGEVAWAKIAPVKDAPPTVLGTDSEDALIAYARCADALIFQPFGSRALKPVYLESLRNAETACKNALAAAPQMKAAQSALAVVQATLGNHAKAAEITEALAKDGYHDTHTMIANLTRLRGTGKWDDAFKSVAQAIEASPGMLLARGYQGELQNLRGKHKEALATYQAYLERAPDHPYVLHRIGYTHGKLGDNAKAIEWTQKALALDTGPEVQLELASRYIDAAQFADALPILKKIVDAKTADPEIIVRYGYAQLMAKQLDEAKKTLNAAIRAATQQQEWRTRGRAYYNLAKIAGREGNINDALRFLDEAVGEGYLDEKLFKADPDLAAAAKDKRFANILKKKGAGE